MLFCGIVWKSEGIGFGINRKIRGPTKEKLKDDKLWLMGKLENGLGETNYHYYYYLLLLLYICVGKVANKSPKTL